MDRFKQVFENLEKEGRKALVSYMTYGFPDIESSEKLIKDIATESDIVEVGIPFSDPMADGPIIQEASRLALLNGASVRKAVEFVRDLRKIYSGAIVIMSYFNPVYRYGIKDFFRDLSGNGADGIIIPDMPLEETGVVNQAKNLLKTILMVAPTTPQDRIKLICKKSEGFVYVVSSLGVTGTRDRFSEDVIDFVSYVKQVSPVPVCIGFGISNPEQASLFSKYADGIIIGSALIKLVNENLPIDNSTSKVLSFLRKIRTSLTYG